MQQGKLTGANKSHQKQIRQLAKQDYTPQQISDATKVNLATVLSFFQTYTGKSDKEMEKYSKIDHSSSVMSDAEAAATKILEQAETNAAKIATETAAAKSELEALKKEIADAEALKVANAEAAEADEEANKSKSGRPKAK